LRRRAGQHRRSVTRDKTYLVRRLGAGTALPEDSL
jgi:hypothetical protein